MSQSTASLVGAHPVHFFGLRALPGTPKRLRSRPEHRYPGSLAHRSGVAVLQ
jgi:hypothetical protein